MKPNFGHQFRINPAEMEYVNDKLIITERIYCETLGNLESAICEEIIRTAKNAGITTLVLLNKEAIVSAMTKATPMVPKDDGWLYCPVCGRDILMDRFKFCPDCGQAIDWGVDDGD